jgi:REP element-mobilizing transposase RayT
MAHPPRIPVWLRWGQEDVYFVTFCVTGRRPVLANEPAWVALSHAIDRLEKWTVIAAVLMPDHLHLLAAPKAREEAVGNLSGALKRWMRQELQAPWQWQPGCFDRLLRSGESASQKWLYIRENPVRAGLVKDWRDWPYRFGFDEIVGQALRRPRQPERLPYKDPLPARYRWPHLPRLRAQQPAQKQKRRTGSRRKILPHPGKAKGQARPPGHGCLRGDDDARGGAEGGCPAYRPRLSRSARLSTNKSPTSWRDVLSRIAPPPPGAGVSQAHRRRFLLA